jgi:hypothetical protein
VEPAGEVPLESNDVGATSTGYHDDDENDLAITACPRGAWDKFLKKGVAPNLSRYERGE